MAKKDKISLTDTVSTDALKSFDDMLEESMDSTIESTNYDGNDVESNNHSHNCVAESVSIEENPIENEIFSRKDKICPFKDPNFNNYSSINDKLIEIYDDFMRDTKITIASISSVAMNEAYIKARWLSKMIMAKRVHKELKAEHTALRNRIKEMVVERSKNNAAFIRQKQTIDSVVDNDNNLKTLVAKIEDAKMIEEYYVYLYGILNNFGFQIKNSIDTLNFERGM